MLWKKRAKNRKVRSEVDVTWNVQLCMWEVRKESVGEIIGKHEVGGKTYKIGGKYVNGGGREGKEGERFSLVNAMWGGGNIWVRGKNTRCGRDMRRN